jgi:hypothetical protein
MGSMNEISELIHRLHTDHYYEFEGLEREEETFVVRSYSYVAKKYQRHLFDPDGNYIDTEDE